MLLAGFYYRVMIFLKFEPGLIPRNLWYFAYVIDWIVFCSIFRPELVTSYLPPGLASKVNTKGK